MIRRLPRFEIAGFYEFSVVGIGLETYQFAIMSKPHQDSDFDVDYDEMERIFKTPDVIDVPCIWDVMDAYRTTLYAFGASRETVEEMAQSVMDMLTGKAA